MAHLGLEHVCKDFQQLPKQGTIQRWVRDVDGCHEGPDKIQLLTSILSLGDDAAKDNDTSGKTRSFLTFLIYLNNNFQGGETRYYYAAPVKGMEARGVTPKIGSIMIFPQGNSASILHEGSAVTRGSKYVIRTDVLYSSNIST